MQDEIESLREQLRARADPALNGCANGAHGAANGALPSQEELIELASKLEVWKLRGWFFLFRKSR